MVSDNKSRKPLHFKETAEDKVYKEDIQHRPDSSETSHISEMKEQIKQEETRRAQAQQVVEDTPENLLICMEHCGKCPSLPFPPEPLLFCARGCSAETVSKKSCNCPACPIYRKYRLQNLYFCETGKATEKK